jgi:hypothetical protein
MRRDAGRHDEGAGAVTSTLAGQLALNVDAFGEPPEVRLAIGTG